jgi:hypothetical protein
MTTERSARASAVVALVASLLMIGCSATQSTPSASLRADIGEVPPELRSEYQSFAVNCSKCHDLDRALAAPVTDTRHWDIYVAKMMRTAGSAIRADEAPHILRFLYWYTGKKNSRGGAGEDTAKTIEEATPPRPEPESVGTTPESTSEPSPAPVPNVTSQTEGESKP